MFGYVIPDKPNMFMKDFTLYRAFYCGLCKSIGKQCGQCMRLTTNYDMTFLNILVHAVCDCDVEIRNEVCILNPFRKKSIVRTDELSRQIVHFNTILMHYKCVDDVIDSKSLGKRLLDGMLVRRKFRKARKELPQVDAAIEQGYRELRKLEAEHCDSPDRAAHPFAQSMADAVRSLLGERYTDDIGTVVYQLGKWIYLADALDDVEEDARKHNYNVFLQGYTFRDRATLLADKGEDISLALMGCYRTMCDAFERIPVAKYEGVLTNILWYGVLERTRTMLRSTEKCKTIRI